MLIDKSNVFEELANAKGVTFLGITPLGERHAVLKLLWHDQPISLTISLTEVLEFNKPAQAGYKLKDGKLRGRGRAARGQNAKFSDEPYKDADTLKSLVDELGSLRAVADRLGVSEVTVSKWWLEHGFEPLRPQPDAKTRAANKRAIREALEQDNPPTQNELAERLGISKATVSRLVKQIKETA
jgi:transcriptional regulator with XRE-family HTH domain